MIPSRFKPFMLAAVAAALGLATAGWIGWARAITIGANGFFIVYLALTLLSVPALTGSYLKTHAASGDAPVMLIFLVTLGTVAAALVSLFIVINADRSPGALEYGLALLSVPLGWFTIHLMAAIHYAHLFWQPPLGQDHPRKGLEFPGTKQPEGWDFVYFAFVIGMTAQTSDVQITGAHMRRFTLMHAVASFFFNTVLVAAAVKCRGRAPKLTKR